jgi:hypothetical protein
MCLARSSAVSFGSTSASISLSRVGAVGLAPILVYWLAGLIRRDFRSKRADRGTGGRPVGKAGEEVAERRDTARPG